MFYFADFGGGAVGMEAESSLTQPQHEAARTLLAESTVEVTCRYSYLYTEADRF